MSKVDQLIVEAQKTRGVNSEKIARQALEIMQKAGGIYSHWATDQHKDRTEHFDELVLGLDGTEYKIGIGSSETNRRDDRKKYPDIYHLVVLPGQTPEQITLKVSALLGL